MDKKSILIVDDVKENLDILVQILGSRYRVKPAPNGPLALKIAQKTVPDLILLDIIMPGMDGYEVFERLKEQEKSAGIPVVFVSSNDNEKEKTRGLEMGAAGYLIKPVSPEALLAMCTRILKE